jgi:hypothetical protein
MRFNRLLSSFLLITAIFVSCEENDNLPGGGKATPPVLQIQVTDGGVAASGADVELYATLADFNGCSNVVETLTTNSSGIVEFPLKSYAPGAYYFSVISGNKRNWTATRVTPVLNITGGTTVVKTTIASFTPTITAPSSMSSGSTVTLSIPDAPRVTGSITWSIVSGAGELSSTTARSISLITEKSDTPYSIDVEVEVEYCGFEPVILQKTIEVAAFCDYDASTWEGDYSALEDYGDGDTYGPYDVTFVQDGTDPNKFIFDNFWDSGITAYVIFNPNSNTITFPDQDDGDGEAISGSGTYEQCTNTFTITTEYAGYTFEYVFTKQ